MPSVEIYDPAMCCSTGVCGPSVDPALTRFAADIASLDATGIEVRRYGLASEPARFVERGEVHAVLSAQGEEGLPVVVIDGVLKCTGRYPSRAELAAWTGAPTLGALSAPMETTSEGGCCAPGEC